MPGSLEDDGEDQVSAEDLWDAVDWRNLEGKDGPKAGYLDGSQSQWPPEAWDAFKGDPVVKITVLAAEGADAYDGETGNAGPDAVAGAMANAVADGRHPWLYSNKDLLGSYLAALRGKNVYPKDRSEWPKPGVYLWLADPSGNIRSGAWVPPVDPVAVQDAFLGGFDHSTLFVDLGAKPAPQPPIPPVPGPQPGGVVEVLVPELSEGATGDSVRAVQTLLGGVAVDGVFGPVTKSRVEQYQGAHQLGVDGVVGVHTWGSLLGHPQ